MSAVVKLSLDRSLAAFDPSSPSAERERALLTALPEPVREALAQGSVSRRSRFADDAFDDVHEDWRPAVAATSRQAALARRALDELNRGPLAPASPNHLLARVLALLSHYPAKGMTPEVERMVALDWAEDLGEFPAWAIDQAARTWRRTKKWRPAIAEMRALCADACRRERELADRLEAIGRAATACDVAPTNRVRELASAALRRMP